MTDQNGITTIYHGLENVTRIHRRYHGSGLVVTMNHAGKKKRTQWLRELREKGVLKNAQTKDGRPNGSRTRNAGTSAAIGR